MAPNEATNNLRLELAEQADLLEQAIVEEAKARGIDLPEPTDSTVDSYGYWRAVAMAVEQRCTPLPAPSIRKSSGDIGRL